MNAVEKMKRYRIQHGYSIKDMSLKSGASETLLKMVENGMVTHPHIARQIGKAYHLDKTDILELIPENHRPGPYYDPDKYKEPEHIGNNGLFTKTSKREKEVRAYISSNSRALKENGRRGVIK